MYILKENPVHILCPLENVSNQWYEVSVFAVLSQVTGSYSVPITWFKSKPLILCIFYMYYYT